MKLTVEQKQKWVDALRSGDFQQGTGTLQTSVGYCCLGVFCVVNNLQISEDGMSVVVDDKSDGYKPLAEILDFDNVTTLYEMNDTLRKSFSEIADYIEGNFLTKIK